MRVDHLVARSYLSREGQIVCGCDGDERQLIRSTKVLKAELLEIILMTIKIYCFNDDDDDDDDAYRDVGGVLMVGWWCWR